MRMQFAHDFTNLSHRLVLLAVLPLLLASPLAAVGVRDLARTGPTKNVGDSPLENLMKNRVYFGTITGPCPGPFFSEVPSSTSTSIGMEVTYLLTDLNPCETYFAQVTAVDTAGSESGGSLACSRRGTA